MNDLEKNQAYLPSIMNMKNYKFLFSIVIPVYNVEKYLRETLESLENQTLNFKDFVQVILINDGSTDNSEKVCLEFRDKYPDNVIYIKKENGGVSSARNVGMKYVEGKYVNFVDSDDKLSKDVLYKVLKFFENHYHEIDFVSIAIRYFEARKGLHPLSKKFNADKIIDVTTNPHDLQLNVSSVFIKSEVALQYRFDESLKYGEDAKFINQILIRKMKYGGLKSAEYLYRIRKDQTSAIQNSRFDKDWYADSLENFSLDLLKYVENELGEVPYYIQQVILYDLQWKFKIQDKNNRILTEEERENFFRAVRQVLEYIDVISILTHRFMTVHYKSYLLKLKLGEKFNQSLKFTPFLENFKLEIEEYPFYHAGFNVLTILNVVNTSQELVLDVQLDTILNPEDISVYAKFQNCLFEAVRLQRTFNVVYSHNQIVKNFPIYRLSIKLNEDSLTNEKLEFFLEVQGKKYPLRYNIYHRLNLSKGKAHYKVLDKIIIITGKKFIYIQKNTLLNRIKREVKYLMNLRTLKLSGAKKAILVRLFFKFMKAFYKKKVYLFMDRFDKADDNAEVLFKYYLEKDKKAKKYFVLDKKSKDFNRMSKIGPTIEYGSNKHKLLLLLSDKVISSQADDLIFNPFGSTIQYYKDLMNYKFIFLQHGVMQNDLSQWLHKYNKHIDIFITSSEKERNSIASEKYGYVENQVRLTGLPRHDRLQDTQTEIKQIVIMPTWRKEYATPLNEKMIRPYNPKFKESTYFQHLNDLLNHKGLFELAKERNIQIKLILHPNHKEQLKDFSVNEVASVVNPDDIKYYEVFNQASLLITDYSSVAFDFAYLRKPIIYYQFDQEEFNKNHMEFDYFDYEKVGFGPVCLELEEVIKEIKSIVENNYQMAPFYKQRVDEFYKYHDNNNCARVYKEIETLDKSTKAR